MLRLQLTELPCGKFLQVLTKQKCEAAARFSALPQPEVPQPEVPQPQPAITLNVPPVTGDGRRSLFGASDESIKADGDSTCAQKYTWSTVEHIQSRVGARSGGGADNDGAAVTAQSGISVLLADPDTLWHVGAIGAARRGAGGKFRSAARVNSAASACSSRAPPHHHHRPLPPL